MPESQVEIVGVTRFQINVTAADMVDWEPKRIQQFFDGLAQAQRAISGSQEKPE
jgi:hypothetical protein